MPRWSGSGNGKQPGSGASKPSKVVTIKIASQYLNSILAEDLVIGTSHIREDAATVLKFHGSYQQDDRDLRTQMKLAGGEGEGVPVHGPGSGSSEVSSTPASTWESTSWARTTVGNGTLRITTRQEFQLHGVLKDDSDGDDPGRSTRCFSRPLQRPAATSKPQHVSSAARPRSTTASAPRCRPTPSGSRRTALRGRRATGRSGSTARRSTIRPSPPPVRFRFPPVGR